MRRSYRLTALFPFWACAFHSTCSWFYRAPRILLPNSLQLRQPGDSLLSQQTSKRLRMTVEQHCLGVQRLPRGSSFAPTPWNHTEGTTFPGRERACKGCFVFSTPSPAPTTSLPPTAKAGTSPSGHGWWAPYNSGDSAPWWQLETRLMNAVLFIRDRKGRPGASRHLPFQ